MDDLQEIRDRLRRSVDLTVELVSAIPEGALGERLPGLPSNSIGQQLWCVVGARESYTHAIVAGEWRGFDCSLTAEELEESVALAEALRRSGNDLLAAITAENGRTAARRGWMLDLLEHEASHQGQLIRYLYGLKLPIPEGWRARYALS